MKKGLLTSFLVLCGLVALFACTTPLPKYKLTLNTNDDTMGTVSGAGEYEENASVTVTASINQNYEFVGWFEGTTLKSKLQEYSFKMPGNDYTLEARFQAEPSEETYTVTFNSNEGTNVNSITDIKENEKIKEPTSPTKEGHTFNGWYKESTLSNKWDFNIDVVMDNITLYAKWDINKYEVSFNSNEGSAVTEYKDVPWNTKIEEPTAPTKQDFEFLGWYKESTLSNKWDFNVDVVKSSITLYAKWQGPSSTVSFNSVGGSEVSQITDVPYGTKIVSPTPPTREGYEFDKWYKDVNFTKEWDFSVDTVIEDIVLYAGWKRILLEVTFDTNSDTKINSIRIEYDSLISPPNTTPSKLGYEFIGWYSDPEFSNPWRFHLDRVTKDMTLHARLDPLVFDVHFVKNSADPSIYDMPEKQSVPCLNLASLPASDPKSYIGTFLGWFADEACTEPFSFDQFEITEETYIFAKWEVVDRVYMELSEYALTTKTLDNFAVGGNLTVTVTPHVEVAEKIENITVLANGKSYLYTDSPITHVITESDVLQGFIVLETLITLNEVSVILTVDETLYYTAYLMGNTFRYLDTVIAVVELNHNQIFLGWYDNDLYAGEALSKDLIYSFQVTEDVHLYPYVLDQVKISYSEDFILEVMLIIDGVEYHLSKEDKCGYFPAGITINKIELVVATDITVENIYLNGELFLTTNPILLVGGSDAIISGDYLGLNEESYKIYANRVDVQHDLIDGEYFYLSSRNLASITDIITNPNVFIGLNTKSDGTGVFIDFYNDYGYMGQDLYMISTIHATNANPFLETATYIFSESFEMVFIVKRGAASEYSLLAIDSYQGVVMNEYTLYYFGNHAYAFYGYNVMHHFYVDNGLTFLDNRLFYTTGYNLVSVFFHIDDGFEYAIAVQKTLLVPDKGIEAFNKIYYNNIWFDLTHWSDDKNEKVTSIDPFKCTKYYAYSVYEGINLTINVDGKVLKTNIDYNHNLSDYLYRELGGFYIVTSIIGKGYGEMSLESDFSFYQVNNITEVTIEGFDVPTYSEFSDSRYWMIESHVELDFNYRSVNVSRDSLTGFKLSIDNSYQLHVLFSGYENGKWVLSSVRSDEVGYMEIISGGICIRIEHPDYIIEGDFIIEYVVIVSIVNSDYNYIEVPVGSAIREELFFGLIMEYKVLSYDFAGLIPYLLDKLYQDTVLYCRQNIFTITVDYGDNVASTGETGLTDFQISSKEDLKAITNVIFDSKVILGYYTESELINDVPLEFIFSDVTLYPRFKNITNDISSLGLDNQLFLLREEYHWLSLLHFRDGKLFVNGKEASVVIENSKYFIISYYNPYGYQINHYLILNDGVLESDFGSDVTKLTSYDAILNIIHVNDFEFIESRLLILGDIESFSLTDEPGYITYWYASLEDANNNTNRISSLEITKNYHEVFVKVVPLEVTMEISTIDEFSDYFGINSLKFNEDPDQISSIARIFLHQYHIPGFTYLGSYYINNNNDKVYLDYETVIDHYDEVLIELLTIDDKTIYIEFLESASDDLKGELLGKWVSTSFSSQNYYIYVEVLKNNTLHLVETVGDQFRFEIGYYYMEESDLIINFGSFHYTIVKEGTGYRVTGINRDLNFLLERQLGFDVSNLVGYYQDSSSNTIEIRRNGYIYMYYEGITEYPIILHKDKYYMVDVNARNLSSRAAMEIVLIDGNISFNGEVFTKYQPCDVDLSGVYLMSGMEIPVFIDANGFFTGFIFYGFIFQNEEGIFIFELGSSSTMELQIIESTIYIMYEEGGQIMPLELIPLEHADLNETYKYYRDGYNPNFYEIIEFKSGCAEIFLYDNPLDYFPIQIFEMEGELYLLYFEYGNPMFDFIEMDEAGNISSFFGEYFEPIRS